MIDITNISNEEINTLVTKYTNILEIFRPETKPYMAYLINISVNYVEEKYKNLSSYWKTWTIVLIKKYFDNIKTVDDVKKIIDEFILFHSTQYQQYIDNIVSASDWDKDDGFINYFMNR